MYGDAIHLPPLIACEMLVPNQPYMSD
jgi:hypothetical protein